MKIENDIVTIEASDLVAFSDVARAALQSRMAVPPEVQLSTHVNRLVALAKSNFGAEQSKNIADIATALAGDPTKIADVLPILNQARAVLGLDAKAQSAVVEDGK